jgi:hypothetical protein
VRIEKQTIEVDCCQEGILRFGLVVEVAVLVGLVCVNLENLSERRFV